VCEAHTHSARLIAASPGFSLSTLQHNATERKRWIDGAVESVSSRFLDGMTFDFEDAIDSSSGSPTRELSQVYTNLVRETTAALHAAVPGSQTSVCVPWEPLDSGRDYDYEGLAAGSDFLYIMGYDTRAQIFGRCIASANSPPAALEHGVHRFLARGVPAHKLVLGVPFYGYAYPCLNSGVMDDVCEIPRMAWRGVNCSEVVGDEFQYMDVMNLLDNNVCPPKLDPPAKVCNVTTGRRWDENTASPYFNFLADGHLKQMWYDDPASLLIKRGIVTRLGLRGFGPYQLDDLDTNGTRTGNPRAREESRRMWEVLSLEP
jgi:di-N-acetylchitobiase